MSPRAERPQVHKTRPHSRVPTTRIATALYKSPSLTDFNSNLWLSEAQTLQCSGAVDDGLLYCRIFGHIFGRIFDRIFSRIFGRIFDRIFGRIFDRIFGRIFGRIFDRSRVRFGRSVRFVGRSTWPYLLHGPDSFPGWPGQTSVQTGPAVSQHLPPAVAVPTSAISWPLLALMPLFSSSFLPGEAPGVVATHPLHPLMVEDLHFSPLPSNCIPPFLFSFPSP
jgi:hypothetical protein